MVIRRGFAELKKRRASDGKPVTDMHLGLHVGKVFYGNVGSRERLEFTVIGPAVNEASRIAAMCRSLDQPVLTSAAFTGVGDVKRPNVPENLNAPKPVVKSGAAPGTGLAVSAGNTNGSASARFNRRADPPARRRRREQRGAEDGMALQAARLFPLAPSGLFGHATPIRTALACLLWSARRNHKTVKVDRR